MLKKKRKREEKADREEGWRRRNAGNRRWAYQCGKARLGIAGGDGEVMC